MPAREGVRGVGPGIKGATGWYIKWGPNWGASLPWFRGRRLRWAPHHGLQRVEWSRGRWYVERQLLGSSRVKGERSV